MTAIVHSETQIARIALGKGSKEERAEVLMDNPLAKELVIKFWNNGFVCAQCEGFHSLGRPGSGLNGVCHKVRQAGYTSPNLLAKVLSFSLKTEVWIVVLLFQMDVFFGRKNRRLSRARHRMGKICFLTTQRMVR
jgi:hypothetical protein